MTPDSFSDLALFLVCLGILHRCWWVQTDRAAIGLAGLLIGFAAALGVLRFSTWTEIGDLVKGVHQFASVLAAVAGFPMLALGIGMGIAYWPGWLFWASLTLILGLRHPPPLNDLTPLDERRRLVAFGSLPTPTSDVSAPADFVAGFQVR